MVMDAVEQVVAVVGALTGVLLLAAMVVSGWIGVRPEPVPVPVRTRR